MHRNKASSLAETGSDASTSSSSSSEDEVATRKRPKTTAQKVSRSVVGKRETELTARVKELETILSMEKANKETETAKLAFLVMIIDQS
jgi:hypothetical protein